MSDELLQKAIGCLSISDVYLRETQSTINKDFDPKIANQSLGTQLRFSAERVDGIDAELVVGASNDKQAVKLVRIHILAGLRFVSGGLSDETLNNPEELAKHIKAEINASFIAEYRITCDELSIDAIQEFAQRNAVYHVWPYWREYAQSICNRMQLPQVIMPMFQLKPIEKKVISEQDAIEVIKTNGHQ